MIEITHIKTYRVLCEANWECPAGCHGTGPSGYSRQDAMEVAEEHGF